MKNNFNEVISEDASPNPEYLIKSIAEQGYSLETSLADLMDNSISAKAEKIEVLIKMDQEPFTLFLADNGMGMNESELVKSMQFPSNSPEEKRSGNDLGRFGLGMKTASFSQTRYFTVLSKKKGGKKYAGRTWDVNYLKNNGWRLIINSEEEIEIIIEQYKTLSKGHLNEFESFDANTIVIWKGLYKFENYLEEGNRQNALKKQITEITSDYLALVFHRFLEKTSNPLQIRINNSLISPFNPFPNHEKDFRPIEYKQKSFSTDTIKIEGFILPSRSIDESQKGLTNWTTKNRGLMDLEGIYIYRADRIILFGGWNGLIKKAPRLQLARLRVDVGNSVDHLLHLNVAKSQVVIPHDLIKAFERYIEELKIEAEREFYNRGIRKFSGNKKESISQLFERKASNKGVLLELNSDFPLLKSLKNELKNDQLSKLNLILRMVNTRINSIRQSHEDHSFIGVEEKDGLSLKDILICIQQLKDNGLSAEQIKNDILPNLGYTESSLPKEIMDLLK
jgi:hypothetical protein